MIQCSIRLNAKVVRWKFSLKNDGSMLDWNLTKVWKYKPPKFELQIWFKRRCWKSKPIALVYISTMVLTSFHHHLYLFATDVVLRRLAWGNLTVWFHLLYWYCFRVPMYVAVSLAFMLIPSTQQSQFSRLSVHSFPQFMYIQILSVALYLVLCLYFVAWGQAALSRVKKDHTIITVWKWPFLSVFLQHTKTKTNKPDFLLAVLKQCKLKQCAAEVIRNIHNLGIKGSFGTESASLAQLFLLTWISRVSLATVAIRHSEMIS